MVRDTRKNKEYFESSIERYTESIDFVRENLQSGQAKESRIGSMKSSLYTDIIKRVIAYYSIGYSLPQVRESLIDAIKDIDLICHNSYYMDSNKLPAETYTEILWTISLAILLDLERSHFQKISEAWEKLNKPDRLVDLLLSYKLVQRSISETLYYLAEFPKMAVRYEPLIDMFATEDESEKLKCIKEYLKNWYVRHQICVWHGNHKKHHYFGYWSFEAAALMKINDLKNSRIEKNKYFPPDLEGSEA